MAILNKYKKIQNELGIIGDSEQIRELLELVMSIAPTNISVLITGESGTGKEIFAKALHQLSTRKDKNMISFNCGAMPEGLLESELFGHQKGAFTGAIANKKGYFELADGGTILLDEIGEMSLQTQVKLLRVLETGEFMRVGSGELQQVDVRIIAATNRDLGLMVQRNEFRKDLYYRLKAIEMHLPPLREHREDIVLLFKKFVNDVLEKQKIFYHSFSDEALDAIYDYSWPGNVRELRNFVETILVLARGQQITVGMVKEHLAHYQDETVQIPTTLPMPMGMSIEEAERELVYKALVSLGLEVKEMKGMLGQLFERLNGPVKNGLVYEPLESQNIGPEIKPLDELERELIEKALDKFRGNRRKVSKALNISERTLYRKIKEYGLA